MRLVWLHRAQEAWPAEPVNKGRPLTRTKPSEAQGVVKSAGDARERSPSQGAGAVLLSAAGSRPPGFSASPARAPLTAGPRLRQDRQALFTTPDPWMSLCPTDPHEGDPRCSEARPVEEDFPAFFPPLSCHHRPLPSTEWRSAGGCPCRTDAWDRGGLGVRQPISYCPWTQT